MLVSEDTVKKSRGRKKQQQDKAESMPAIPAAEAVPEANGRRIIAGAAAVPIVKSEELGAGEHPMPAGIAFQMF